MFAPPGLTKRLEQYSSSSPSGAKTLDCPSLFDLDPKGGNSTAFYFASADLKGLGQERFATLGLKDWDSPPF